MWVSAKCFSIWIQHHQENLVFGKWDCIENKQREETATEWEEIFGDHICENEFMSKQVRNSNSIATPQIYLKH